MGYGMRGRNVHMRTGYVGVVVYGCCGDACWSGVVLVVYVGGVGPGELPSGGGI